jgi:NTE family protein
MADTEDQTPRRTEVARTGAPKHSLEAYGARPKEERKGIALCLSGGGFRAALFHVGALRRLNELGVLSEVDTISSVSGGSIVSSHLAQRIGSWPQRGKVIADWETRVEEPFRALSRRNLRTWPIVKRLLPWNWLRSSTAIEALQGSYDRHLEGLKLTSLPDRPRFIFCATDMVFGVNWVFDSGPHGAQSGRLGDYEAGYLSPAPAWPVARAVAGSSCFPPVFAPLPMHLQPEDLRDGEYKKLDRDKLVKRISLTDGGAYDNLGLEPVWKDHEIVMVSDGGAVFEAEEGACLIWRVSRPLSIATNQSTSLRKRWLISNFNSGELDGAYWGIGSTVEHYEVQTPGYPEELVDDRISEVRTDLDAFSEAEYAVLVNHGYLLGEAAVRRHLPAMIAPDAEPLRIPYPEWMDEGRVEEALKNSHKRKLLGRW